MLHDWFSSWLRECGGPPCFRIWGRAETERDWRQIDVLATARRNRDSGWPMWAGVCITWTDSVIAVGCDFAEQLLRELAVFAVSRSSPVMIPTGRLRGAGIPSNCEILAHEIGHTWQARRLGGFYWPLVGALTRFREGSHWWNFFENNASQIGVFGGIIAGTLQHEVMQRLGVTRSIESG
jgi:hypothetical protein